MRKVRSTNKSRPIAIVRAIGFPLEETIAAPSQAAEKEPRECRTLAFFGR